MTAPKEKCRMWCGSSIKHEPHIWGVRSQHFCDGKRARTFVRHGRA